MKNNWKIANQLTDMSIDNSNMTKARESQYTEIVV